jgi:L-lactate dehydrogenase complex protein LldF
VTTEGGHPRAGQRGAFEARIAAALRNPTLQIALDRNHERRVLGRDQAFAALPDAEAARDRGRAIRLDALAHLDRYLEQFAGNVERCGGHVYWAADAAEARHIVVGLVRAAAVHRPPGRSGPTLVAKSKSMVSEEIDLNRALEAEGVRVVETDLGEFIVQLRGEPPAHIITPAVHLRREDVSALFEARFGMAPTLDVAHMTAVARAELRRAFFSADVGISGVNFGVAETGTLALVTNEGNGRLCTTLPPVHIALMGLERLVPTPADLEVMMRILPRSATAQNLSTYVSMLSGPRRAGESDGPEELHVVLLDNGRARMLGGPLAESLLCIRCGACLNVCPVFTKIGGHAYGSPYGGPIGSVVSAGLFGSEFSQLANASTLCGACRDICPVRIDIPTMLLAVRQQYVAAGKPPGWLKLGMRLWGWVLGRPGTYRLAQRASALAARLIGRGQWLRRLPPPLSAWTDRRDFPPFAARPFRERWKSRAASEPVSGPGTRWRE